MQIYISITAKEKNGDIRMSEMFVDPKEAMHWIMDVGEDMQVKEAEFLAGKVD